jgi:glycosyltransferase involved in cell wall biosynthesis
MNEALPVSIFLITKNESDRLGATLRAIGGLSDDVIVVDSGSTDGTVELARSLGARVIHNPWTGYGPQKRFGEDQCRHDWVLNLDADEVMPPELVAEIRDVFAQGRHRAADGFLIRFAEVFPGEARPHPWAYSHAYIRLYRRSRGRFAASPVHDAVAMEPGARLERLRGIVHHFSVRSLGDQLAKLNRYSDQQAEDLDARGVVLPTWRVFGELPAAFLKAYLGRRHFLRGTYGVLTAMNYAISRHLRVAKHYERRRLRRAKGTSSVR